MVSASLVQVKGWQRSCQPLKDLGHRVLEALTDPQSDDYMKVRQF